MNTTTQTTINKEVNVTSWYFQNKKQLIGFPRRIELDQEEYTFKDGLRVIINKGTEVIQQFEMTDGQSNFRLRNSGKSNLWTLVSITSGVG